MPPTDEDLAWFRSTFHPIPKPALPDDCVEYALYIFNSTFAPSNNSELQVRLREIQKHAASLQKKWLKDYIWQRQGFALEVAKEDGVSLLRGRTEYGDSIEDEWVVVWLLREISKKFNDLWTKVTDGDGQFLLVEASGTLPAWLEPDVAENRVWINNGGLKIIKPSTATRSARQTTERLSLTDASNTILREPKRLMHSISIEEEAFFRLKEYPRKIAENMHYTLVRIPRKVAFLLRRKPAYIAPATEAFYLRDPVSLKPIQGAKDDASLIFPLNDLVTVTVKFPRVGYAQIRSQEFSAPNIWSTKLPVRSDGGFPRAETGMKLACGFEMLLTDSHYQDKPPVREMKMLLDDIESGDDQLPSDGDISNWPQHQDDEGWLDINFDDLENELENRSGQKKTGKKAEFGDKRAQENLQRIVKQFESFLNDDKAGPDGAGLFDEDTDHDSDDSDDTDDDMSGDLGEDKDASFDEDDFTKMMREMMGMPPNVMDEIMSGKAKGSGSRLTKQDDPSKPEVVGSSSRVMELESSDPEPGEEEMEALMQRMEAELNEGGALDLDPSQTSDAARRAVKGKQKATLVDHGSSDDDDPDNDIDINLAKNLLESFKSQAGMAGPGGNMMGMMGLGLPRDSGDFDENTKRRIRKKGFL